MAVDMMENEKGFLLRSIDKLVRSLKKTTDRFRAFGITGTLGASVVLEWMGVGIEIGVDVDTDK
jgi:hypothetical protein